MTFEKWFEDTFKEPLHSCYGVQFRADEVWQAWQAAQQAAAADKAKLIERLKWADELIDKAVDLMTPEQLGQWEGVRLFQQTEPEPPK